MLKLIKKEFSLAVHPTAWIFLALSAMLLIPNYPYYVVFFYTGLGLFFTCLTGRENRDIDYMLLLPIRKRDIVTARFASTLVLEGLQLVAAAGFAVLRGFLLKEGNQAGMDANTAFFGLALVQLGLMNFIFFTRYYRRPEKVGSAFIVTSIACFGYIGIAEAAAFAAPFVRDVLDVSDPANLPVKLAVLGSGAAVFAALTTLAYHRSVRSFEALDC